MYTIYSRYVYDLTVTRMSRDIIMIATTSLIYYVRVVLKTIANQTDGNQLCLIYFKYLTIYPFTINLLSVVNMALNLEGH